MSRVDVTVQETIDRPVAEVAAFAGDPSNAPTWYRRISFADWVTEPPVAIGSQITFRARFMGRDLVYTYEVTELIHGERLVMQTAEGPFPMRTTYTWVAAGGGSTTMTLRNDGDPTGFARLTAPLMTRAMRRAMAGDLQELKQQLEA